MNKLILMKARQFVLAATTIIAGMASSTAQAEIVFDKTWDFTCVMGNCPIFIDIPPPASPDHEQRIFVEQLDKGDAVAHVEIFNRESCQRFCTQRSIDHQWCAVYGGGSVRIETTSAVPGRKHFRFAVSEYPKAGSSAPKCYGFKLN